MVVVLGVQNLRETKPGFGDSQQSLLLATLGRKVVQFCASPAQICVRNGAWCNSVCLKETADYASVISGFDE